MKVQTIYLLNSTFRFHATLWYAASKASGWQPSQLHAVPYLYAWQAAKMPDRLEILIAV